MPTGTWFTTSNTITVPTTSQIYQYWIDERESVREMTQPTTQTISIDPASTADTYTVWFSWCEEIGRESGRMLRMERARYQQDYPPPLHQAHVINYLDRKMRMEHRRARRRALATLLRNLDEHQRDLFREFGYFAVVGGKTGQVYRIRKGKVANVDVMHKGKVKHRLCCHPAGSLPEYDIMLVQALHLACNEEHFLKMANVHPAPVHGAEMAGVA